ncbi:hypothetical protein Vafri_20688 [Volvox africanus]|uniref:SCP domain-containing protein n=1 Tax=Volvox africanus TaxID=51714 RepID=A0A8J4BRU1_9CHLO|nr:hypothetical protein Vafri_20688 [Volvox africanus]
MSRRFATPAALAATLVVVVVLALSHHQAAAQETDVVTTTRVANRQRRPPKTKAAQPPRSSPPKQLSPAPSPRRSPPSPSRVSPPSPPSPPPPRSPPPPPNNGSLVGGSCRDIKAVLDVQNKLRAVHKSPPLTWSSALAASATAWAKNQSVKCGGGKSQLTKLGENVFVMHSMPRPSSECAQAVMPWYSENQFYKFDPVKPFTLNLNSGTSQFTQLVWKNTTTVGCGMAVGDSKYWVSGTRYLPAGCLVVVCHYLPMGNVAGEGSFLANVLPNTSYVPL